MKAEELASGYHGLVKATYFDDWEFGKDYVAGVIRNSTSTSTKFNLRMEV